MEFNLISFLYLFFRLAPFIIVSSFTLNSVLNLDLKGLIYLVGILFACFVTTMVSSAFPFSSSSAVCNMFTLTGTGQPISSIPLGQVVLSYTFAYLITIIITYNDKEDSMVKKNVATFIIFPALILADFFWSLKNGCSSFQNLCIAFIIGGGIGALWATVLDKSKMFEMQYFNGISNREVCNRPAKNIFRCKYTNPSKK